MEMFLFGTLWFLILCIQSACRRPHEASHWPVARLGRIWLSAGLNKEWMRLLDDDASIVARGRDAWIMAKRKARKSGRHMFGNTARVPFSRVLHGESVWGTRRRAPKNGYFLRNSPVILNMTGTPRLAAW
ncbi:hypothetical protein F5144DRAFT_161175 [Chaetomium tenue]|uniref:Uncharacterized protein n=1 Tax=Chaetomium tenue TaxID=1854479 RepID=A0ACB7PD75_9PEZI|nr:hypothetical protein F5144DRAFT_161175 [Chaetomium globosum]